MKTTIWTKDFAKATAERIIATVAWTLLAVLAVDGFDLLRADWEGILSAAGLAGLLSLLKCIVANTVTRDGPSLSHSEQTVPATPQAVRDA